MIRSSLLALTFTAIVRAAIGAGHPIAEPKIGTSAYPLLFATVASNGNGFLAVWRTYTYGGGAHIDGVLIDSNGQRISPAAFRIVSFTDALVLAAVGAFSPAAAAIAWNGSQFLVVWNVFQLFGAFVSPTGNVSPRQQVSIDPVAPEHWTFNDTDPKLAWNGKEYLLVWTLQQLPPCFMPICSATTQTRAIRLDSEGHPIGTESVVISEDSRRTSLASNGNNFLLGIDDMNGSHAHIINTHGTSVEVSQPIEIFSSWTLPLTSIVWEGTDYRVIWRYVTPTTWRLGMKRISASGTRGKALGLITDASDSIIPPAIDSHDELIVIPEIPNDSITASSARTVSYRATEMTPLPGAPRAPIAIDATISSGDAVVTWNDASDNEEGFVIEARYSAGYFLLATAPANAEQTRVKLYGQPTLRIRAWNAGGTSEASEDLVPHAPSRRRSVPTE